MTSSQGVPNEIYAAYLAWWGVISGQGDPIRRPNLSLEAFAKGWEAALVAQSASVRADARGVLDHLLSTNVGLDEQSGFCTLRATPEFLRHVLNVRNAL